MWLLYIKSDVLFFIAYYILGYRKKVVRENLDLAFPEKSKAEILNIQKKFFKQLCDMLVETIKSITISEKEIRKRFKVKILKF